MASNPDVPPFIGYVETTVDALRLAHAARQGIIPRITRRLNDYERSTMIKSGAVFIFCVQESQIKRWTDGLLWSQSRILGNFLVYREIDERTTSRGHKKSHLHNDFPSRSLTGESSPDQASLGFRTRDGSDQGTIKTGGLMKKTITVILQESGAEPAHLHLISYYTSEDIRSGKLKRPSTRADIMNLYMPPHIFPLTTFRVPPRVEIGPDRNPRLVEVEDSEYSIPVLSPPLSPADATGESRTHAGLQGTISALKRNQQKTCLATISGLQRVFAAVLNILVVVHNNYANEEALGMLAEKAGLFVLTLVGDVEQGSVCTFSDPDFMNSVIERLGLPEEMNWVLGVLNKSEISFISQRDIARIEAKLIQALEILQESSQ